MLSGVANLPTPVVIAGAALCAIGGYFVGYVAGPDTPSHTTATVVSFDGGSAKLCLEGKAVADLPGLDDSGHLCGRWQRSQGSARPEKGDRFRFVSMRTNSSTGTGKQTLIYGSVVR